MTKLLCANFVRYRLDHIVYYKLDDNGELLIVVLFHVDDVLATYREDYQLDELLSMFTWGSTSLLDNGDFTFKGKEVSLMRVGIEFKIKITQKAFVSELEQGSLKRGRLEGDPRLSADELKDYRSCAGSL